MTKTNRGCPVSHAEFGTDTEIYGHYAILNAEREKARFQFNDTRPRGFWMLQRYDDVQEGFQKHDVWTTAVRSALRPDIGESLLPQDLNGQDHVKLRRILNQFFAPAAVKRMEPMAWQRARELIGEIRPRGKCDFVVEFAIRFPTDLFLALLGLPVSDGDFFLEWSESLFNAFLAGDPKSAADFKAKILNYFDDAVNERRKNPGDPNLDMVSRLIQARIDGEPLSQKDILTICMTLMLAGLDTTRSALGYIFVHLAQHEENRRRLIDDPKLWPAAIEEFIRLYPLVFQVGREVQAGEDFHGLDLEPGDVVWLGIGQAKRDPRKYRDPETFELGRTGVNQNLAFGAGPHRCLGMHLARMELAVALDEWHRQIPDYRIGSGAELVERGGQLTLPTLPLEWDV
jgi:cytochrome P450